MAKLNVRGGISHADVYIHHSVLGNFRPYYSGYLTLSCVYIYEVSVITAAACTIRTSNATRILA